MSINLFETSLDENKLHPYFKEIKSAPEYAKTHKLINEWSEGFLSAEGKQLSLSMNSRLASTLLIGKSILTKHLGCSSLKLTIQRLARILICRTNAKGIFLLKQ